MKIKMKLIPDRFPTALVLLLVVVLGGGYASAPGSISGATTNMVVYATGTATGTTEATEFGWDPTNNQLELLPGTVTAGNAPLIITSTMPSSDPGAAMDGGLTMSVSSAGSWSYTNRAIGVTYAAGYTGNASTIGIGATNNAAGTGTLPFTTLTANLGITGAASGTGAVNVGVRGSGANGTTNIGAAFFATSNGTTNVGAIIRAGFATPTTRVGAWIDLIDDTALPTFTATGLGVSNGAYAVPIQVWNDNTTEFARVADGGNLGLGDTGPDFKLDISASAASDGVMIANTGGFDPQVQLSDADGSADWTVCQDQTGGLAADVLSFGSTACGTGTVLTLQSTGIFVVTPTAETIAADATITANACGGVKQISAASGAVVTNTTNTFTAPAAANTGCILHICNTGGFNITLDANAAFKSAAGADVVMTPDDCLLVMSNGSVWYQLTALLAN